MGSSRRPLEGVFVLLPLPTNTNQQIDFDLLRNNITYLSDSGVQGVIALGSMGEFYSVTSKEFDNVVDVVVDSTRDKIASVIGCSYQNFNECVRRTKYAENAGADGAMVMPSYYLDVNLNEAFNFYQVLDQSISDIQIMVYNFPPASKINITPELWDDLISLNSIKAVKESNGDLNHITRILTKHRNRVNVFAGSEMWTLPMSLLGSKGVVSIFGPGLPKFVVNFYKNCINKNLDDAIIMHRLFVEAGFFINTNNEVGWLKALAEICGQNSGHPRFPYSPLSNEEYELLSDWVSSLKKKFPNYV